MAKKVLIVEDEEIILELLKRKLSSEGYDVLVARDGEEALKLMNIGIEKGELPDLILLDIIMPKMGGFEVMEEINKIPELSKIPVIIISNSGQPVEIDKAQKLGAKDWLIKTEFDPMEVLEKVVRQIGS